MDFYDYGPTTALRAAEEEKDNIKFIGKWTGIGIILYFVINNVFSLIFLDETIYTLYKTNAAFQCTCTIFLSIAGILVPFYLIGRKFSERFSCETMPLSKPYDMKLSGTAIFLGVFICLVGSYISSCFSSLLESMGFSLSSSDMLCPDDFAGRIYYLLTICAVPALCEEVAIRGSVLQPLRRYGDKFAIVVSAFIFAVLHGTVVQLPFAFIAGLGFGYIACMTGSLWPTIIIHFINNFYSCVCEFMINDISDDATLNKVYYITLFILYAVTISGSVVFAFLRGHRSLNKIKTYSQTGQKTKAFFINFAMIIALIIMFISTSSTISR